MLALVPFIAWRGLLGHAADHLEEFLQERQVKQWRRRGGWGEVEEGSFRASDSPIRVRVGVRVKTLLRVDPPVAVQIKVLERVAQPHFP